MSKRTYWTLIIFLFGLCFFLVSLNIFQSTLIIRLANRLEDATQENDSVPEQIPFYPTLYPVNNSYPPMLLGVSSDREFVFGVAYIAENRIWTVEHVFDNESNPQVITLFLGEKYGNEWVSLRNLVCNSWFIEDEKFESDGSCASQELFQIENYHIYKLGTPIVRRRAEDYDVKQVAVWNILNNHWMFFDVVAKDEQEYVAEGNTFDLTGNGLADGISLICEGFSGSPVFLAEDGQLLMEDNNYISIGEARANKVDIRMFQERRHCGSRLWISVVYPEL